MTGLILTVSIIALTVVTASVTTRLILAHAARQQSEQRVVADHVADLIVEYVLADDAGDTTRADQARAHLRDHGVTINEQEES